MSQNNEETVTQQLNLEESANDGFNNYFSKLIHKLPIGEKIELICIQFQNNYFIDKDVKNLTSVDKRIRPTKKVPSNFKIGDNRWRVNMD